MADRLGGLAPRSILDGSAATGELGPASLSPPDVALREIWRGRVWLARPWRLLEETPERIVLWIPRGARTRIPLDENGERLRIPQEVWRLGEGTFEGEAVRITRPGASHSVLLFFAADGSFDCWYVNLEEPLRRTALGFDYLDHKLDLIVTPDGSVRWKDEDELEEAARSGILDAAAVRAEAARVLADPPWPTGWEDWRPDPSWMVPELPPDWDSPA